MKIKLTSKTWHKGEVFNRIGIWNLFIWAGLFVWPMEDRASVWNFLKTVIKLFTVLFSATRGLEMTHSTLTYSFWSGLSMPIVF